MNKSAHLGFSILDISKTNIYELWYSYITPKYGDRAKLCYTDTDNFVIYIKTEDFYEDIANDVERWFNISNYDENDERPLPICKNKKVIGIFKDELKGGKTITEFFALRAKACAYLMKDGSKHKKAKGTKKCVTKRQLIFENYKDSQLNNEIILKSQQRLKIDHHKVHTEEINKNTLSSNDDKRLETFDKITTYPYGTNATIVCENEIMIVREFFVKN